jgi:hypothetical protein
MKPFKTAEISLRLLTLQVITAKKALISILKMQSVKSN